MAYQDAPIQNWYSCPSFKVQLAPFGVLHWKMLYNVLIFGKVSKPRSYEEKTSWPREWVAGSVGCRPITSVCPSQSCSYAISVSTCHLITRLPVSISRDFNVAEAIAMEMCSYITKRFSHYPLFLEVSLASVFRSHGTPIILLGAICE